MSKSPTSLGQRSKSSVNSRLDLSPDLSLLSQSNDSAKNNLTQQHKTVDRGHAMGHFEGKGKVRKWTCIAPIVSISRPLSAQMWITQSYRQYTTSAFPSY